jgi:hypothetical protein
VCSVSECDREASIMRGRGPLGAVAPLEKSWLHLSQVMAGQVFYVCGCRMCVGLFVDYGYIRRTERKIV